MKRIISVLLIVCTLTVCLASCGGTLEDELAGTWRAEWKKSDGYTYIDVIEIKDGGTYEKRTYRYYYSRLNDLVQLPSVRGVYEIKGNAIVLYETTIKYTVYNYTGGQLENGGVYYKRQAT